MDHPFADTLLAEDMLKLYGVNNPRIDISIISSVTPIERRAFFLKVRDDERDEEC